MRYLGADAGFIIRRTQLWWPRHKALIQANTNPLFTNIAEQTRAAFFLGTPHRGSSFSTWGSIVARVLQPLGSNPLLLQEIAYDSLSLLDLDDEFENVVGGKLRVVNFFEQRKTRILKAWFIQWDEFCVKEQSARRGGAENIGLPVDHYGLNKFRTKNASYWIICRKLLQYIKLIESQKQQPFYSVPSSTV
ncbi:hypothetical protein EJ04DRAFT_30403 [Polyplosphaeria fusca]|uniref:Uncharacterized protein n=1 Tax=Polyplosphaeria fusca TaxID=682080 RepID=A0A9P4QTR7_9PLEO|nr:hypothetical protein EJ04DRAFT_30403 [Polyplosphaeria fusca]